jgi:HK97 family phage major capsid protein
VAEQVEDRRDFSADERKALADKGHALPDGSFPITTCEDVDNAVRLVGNASDPAAAKAHTIKRANALGCSLPESWGAAESRSSPGEPASEGRTRPEPGTVEQRALDGDGAATVAGRRLHGVIPYGVESRDLGGWTEVIDRGALARTDISGLIATREHDRAHLLGRYPTTLTTEDRADGLHWSCDLPQSPVGEDVRVAVERGDLRASSWRMVVAPGGERWDGQVRHVTRIAELRDVTVTAAPAYGDEARAEYRSLPAEPHRDREEVEPPTEEATVPEEEVTEPTTGGLRVESRNAPETRAAPEPAPVEERVLTAIRSIKPGESRSLTTTSAAPIDTPELATYIFDRLRPQSVMLSAGIRVMATTREQITWPRTTTDVNPSWTQEGVDIVEGDPAWDQITVVPSKLAHRIVCSNESIDDAPMDLLGWLESHLLKLIGLKLDIGLLEGNPSTGQPGVKGLKYVSGIQTVTSLGTNGGPLTNLDPIAAAIGLIEEANATPSAIVMHPQVWMNAETLKDANQRYLLSPQQDPTQSPSRSLFGVPVFTTSQLSANETRGTSSNTSSIYVFDSSQVVLVRRSDVQMEVDRAQYFSSDQSQIRIKTRVGFVVPFPQAVARVVGVVPS